MEPETLVRYGLAHHRAGRLEAAIGSYQAALDVAPGQADAHHLLGQALYQRAHGAEARAAVERAVELSPRTAIYHNTLGEVLRVQGEYALADRAFADALELDRTYGEAWSNRSALAKADGRLEDAVAFGEQAVEASPDLAAAHNNLGSAWLAASDPENAAKAFQAALGLAPDDTRILGNLGTALTALDRVAEALDYFDRALALAPDTAALVAGRAAARAKTGDLDLAIADYRSAAALDPSDADFHHGLGVACFRRGRAQDAISAFETALTREPNHLAALTNLGKARKRKGHTEAARLALERALRLDPDHVDAYFVLVSLAAESCDWHRLEDLVEELVDVQQVAAREGKILAWLGATTSERNVAAAEATPATETVVLETPTPASAAAERRQLTVMFCDLVGSADLSQRLDAEDLRNVVRAYQESASSVIERYEGHVAQYLGDGLLVYFGHPQAHEDDAERAVRAGRDILRDLEVLNPRLVAEHAVRLSVRIGIHNRSRGRGRDGGQREEGDSRAPAARRTSLRDWKGWPNPTPS